MIIKKDPDEIYCRIWILWKDKLIDDYEFIFYQNYLWLFVLTQLLSCAVERLFYNKKLIVDAVGHNMKEGITEWKLLLIWNGGLNVYDTE